VNGDLRVSAAEEADSPALKVAIVDLLEMGILPRQWLANKAGEANEHLQN
jgi:hypothetical protein